MAEHSHTNRLIDETSPYLRQHAHNPVDWYAWGEEALTKARDENKPILLSIGYSACHWCHVMEKESFENKEVARLMNENFVNIKVDREERPDVDQIYMNAVQMMLGHGGWPLTVFLTPELIPFYGGTYFPPEDRYNIPGFPRVLLGVAEAYRSRPDEIAETATNVLAELRRMGETRESGEAMTTALLDAAFQSLARNYDRRHGGFGNAPKFPAAMNLEFLLRYHHRAGNREALEMVAHTCRRMAEGGMYDQLGGGFHRYSTDAVWLVPHFEKMLYDNALLSRVYLHVYQVTGDTFFRRVAEQTLDYVVREMTAPQGGFYSTQDADSEGVEGKFFVWTLEEIKELLGAADAALMSAYYGVTEEGNFEEKNILHVARPAETVAEELNVTVEHLRQAVERGSQILLAARERRIKPGRDEKILTAWNGMMLASFAEAGAILERPDYLAAAERNAGFILDTLRADGKRLLHTYKDGQAKFHAYQDDYALLAAGLLSLYEANGSLRWLEASLELTEKMNEEFWDTESGGYFYTATSGEQLIVRTKDFLDNATPSGNSVAADLLLRFAVLIGNTGYQSQAVNIFRLNRDAMARHPSAFGCLLGALDFYLSTPKEIVIIGEPEAEATAALAREVWQRYLPNKVLVQAAETDIQSANLVPLLRDRKMIDGQATAYVCENYSCRQPVRTPQELSSQLTASFEKTSGQS
ncbi:MAG: thioredoxin domain-containing protein [Pyrinomonadaceae bacterium]